MFSIRCQIYAGLGGGFLKGIEVDHHHINGLDAVGGDGASCSLLREYRAGRRGPWVQGLDAAVEHLRKAGQVADVLTTGRPRAEHAPFRRWRPVLRPKPTSAWAKSTRPFLSVTLNNALRIRFSELTVALLVLEDSWQFSL